jgi:putative transposase
MEEFTYSERAACKLLELDRSSYRYEPKADRNEKLRQPLIEMAKQKPRYGYRRLPVLLERRGWTVNHKRLYGLYREENLAVRRLRRKRLIRPAVPIAQFQRANEEWSMDFVMDGLATGRAVRVLTIVDSFTRECLAIEVDSCLSSQRVTRVLEWIIHSAGCRSDCAATTARSLPAAISWAGARNGKFNSGPFSQAGRCRTGAWKASTGDCETSA